jgi:hypothetical protein
MTEEVLFRWTVMGFAAVWGLVVGRAFAMEADNRTTAVLAAAYCGAGAGLVSGPPFALIFILVAQLSKPETTLTVLLNKFQSASEGRLYGPQAAIGTMITIPVVILGMLIQKHLVKGFSFGTIRK